jgi:hypothetical protein
MATVLLAFVTVNGHTYLILIIFAYSVKEIETCGGRLSGKRASLQLHSVSTT